MLLIGMFELPYGYYTLLRIVATGVFIWAGVIANSRNEKILPWLFYLIAILFNPIIKIYLSKDLWAVIDVVSAILLFINRHSIEDVKEGK
jgi:hypothetical protein